jgi:hypothetical protein
MKARQSEVGKKGVEAKQAKAGHRRQQVLKYAGSARERDPWAFTSDVARWVSHRVTGIAVGTIENYIRAGERAGTIPRRSGG